MFNALTGGGVGLLAPHVGLLGLFLALALDFGLGLMGLIITGVGDDRCDEMLEASPSRISMALDGSLTGATE